MQLIQNPLRKRMANKSKHARWSAHSTPRDLSCCKLQIGYFLYFNTPVTLLDVYRCDPVRLRVSESNTNRREDKLKSTLVSPQTVLPRCSGAWQQASSDSVLGFRTQCHPIWCGDTLRFAVCWLRAELGRLSVGMKACRRYGRAERL